MSKRSTAERAFVSTLSLSRPGEKDEIIMVHNPSSGKNFRALIEGREQVVVRGAL